MANGLSPKSPRGGLTGTLDLNADGCGCRGPGLTPIGSVGTGRFEPPKGTPGTHGVASGPGGVVVPEWDPTDDPQPSAGDTSCNLDQFHVDGGAVGDLAALDLTMYDYMTTNEVPNGALAVVSGDGRIVYCKAFTYCKTLVDHGEPVFRADVHSKFRIASVSKVITAVATMAAVERGFFGTDGLHAKASAHVDFADQWWGSAVVEPRLWDIELVHLLTHSAGWGEDPLGTNQEWPPGKTYQGSPQYMFEANDFALASAFGACFPIDPKYIWWDQNSTALSGWGVGGTWSYSNHGFVVLGRVVAAAAGMSEADWVTQAVWDRIGATDSTPGRTQLGDRQANEVKYYDRFWPAFPHSYSSSVMEADCRGGRIVSTRSDYNPYGYFNLENSLGGAGWLSSVYDLALFMRDLFGTRDRFGVPRSAMLSANGIRELLTPRRDKDATIEQCLGFETHWRSPNAGDFGKTGHLNGTHAMVYNYGSTVGPESYASVVYVFNRFWRDGASGWYRDLPSNAPENHGDMPYNEADLQAHLDSVLRSITDWGTGDLRGTL